MPTCLFIDNQSTIKLVHNLVLHAGTKHIEILHLFIRERVEASDINKDKLGFKLMPSL